MSCYVVLSIFLRFCENLFQTIVTRYPYRRLGYLCDIFGILQYLNQNVWTNILNNNQNHNITRIGDI